MIVSSRINNRNQTGETRSRTLTAKIQYEDGASARYSLNTSIDVASFIARALEYFTQDAIQNERSEIDLSVKMARVEVNEATAEHLANWFTCDTSFDSIVFASAE